MNNFMRKIELLANIAIIIVALLLSGVLVKTFLLTDSTGSAPRSNQLRAGTKISLPGAEWAQSERTILLVLSHNCRFCTESGAFYRRLASERQGEQRLRLVAVLPQAVSEGQQYLNELGVPVDEVRQASLATLGVRGTPTLILVDRSGVVKDAWIGKLTADQEAEVLLRLPVDQASEDQ